MKAVVAANVDEYIAGFPREVQKDLQTLRETVLKAAPGAEEAIKYSMPTFVLGGNLVSFGAYKSHIGFYPVPRNVDGFKKELAAFEGNKSTMKIPFGSPLPLKLITRIVKYNVERTMERKKAKK